MPMFTMSSASISSALRHCSMACPYNTGIVAVLRQVAVLRVKHSDPVR